MIGYTPWKNIMRATLPNIKPLFWDQHSINSTIRPSIWSIPSKFSSNKWYILQLYILNKSIKFLPLTSSITTLTHTHPLTWPSHTIEISHQAPSLSITTFSFLFYFLPPLHLLLLSQGAYTFTTTTSQSFSLQTPSNPINPSPLKVDFILKQCILK